MVLRVTARLAQRLGRTTPICASCPEAGRRCNAKWTVRATMPAAMTAWNCARVFSRCTACAAGPAGARALDGQALAALGAASVDDGAAATSLHANEKAVGAGAAHFGGLVGTLHDRYSGKPAIILENQGLRQEKPLRPRQAPSPGLT